MRMMFLKRGLISACLAVFLAGCESLPDQMPPEPMTYQELPAFLTNHIPAPTRLVIHNRDWLQLLADYEALRIRANADRRATALIFRNRQAQE